MAALGPYCTAVPSVTRAPAPEPAPECPLAPVMLAAFAATTSRVLSALWAREEFAAEPTLALLCASVLGFGLLARAKRPLRRT